MLRYLQIANVVLLAFGVTFVVTLSVVAILLAFWVGEYPKYESTLSGVLRVVLLAGILAAAGALCVRSLQWSVAVLACAAIRRMGCIDGGAVLGLTCWESGEVMKVLCLSGSARAASFNSALLAVAAAIWRLAIST